VKCCEEVQTAAALNGLLFKVENAGNLVATGQLVPVKNTHFFEMGGCFVSTLYQGLGIQKILIASRAAGLAAFCGRQPVLVSAVDPKKSSASLHNILRAGFRSLSPYPQELLAPCSGCRKRKLLPPGRLCCCDFFFLPRERHRRLVADFLQMAEETLLLGRGGNPLVLRNASRNAVDPERRKLLEEFVAGRVETMA
jgi:hypothetical protein